MDLQLLEEQYRSTLEAYVENNNEGLLARGYEIARSALRDGRGVIDMAAIHHQALRQLCSRRPFSEELLDKVANFFAECLSPFEMSHRGAREGTLALRHLNEVLEAELKRIAHVLHDEAGQLLASVHIALANVAADFPPAAQARFDSIQDLLGQIETELRSLSHELRPTVLDNLGLVPALEFLADRVSRRTGLTISVEADTEERLAATIETALYRIVQEALNNVVKHAQASHATVELECSSSKVVCRVRDDGVGFAARGEPSTQGLGLLGIRERLNALGGSLTVQTGYERGTTIVAEIPTGG